MIRIDEFGVWSLVFSRFLGIERWNSSPLIFGGNEFTHKIESINSLRLGLFGIDSYNLVEI